MNYTKLFEMLISAIIITIMVIVLMPMIIGLYKEFYETINFIKEFRS